MLERIRLEWRWGKADRKPLAKTKFKCTSRATYRHLLYSEALMFLLLRDEEPSRPARHAHTSYSLSVLWLFIFVHISCLSLSSFLTYNSFVTTSVVEFTQTLPRLRYSLPAICPFMSIVFSHLWELGSSLPTALRGPSSLNSRCPHLKMPSVSWLFTD